MAPPHFVFDTRWRRRKKEEKNYISATIRISREILCLPYARFFWKIIVIQHYLDLDLNLVYFIMQNYLVTREWNEADCLDPLIYF